MAELAACYFRVEPLEDCVDPDPCGTPAAHASAFFRVDVDDGAGGGQPLFSVEPLPGGGTITGLPELDLTGSTPTDNV